jgi:NAD(P)-dependent dehydrogenase (short-subunit alcohol dehydrogenase family)
MDLELNGKVAIATGGSRGIDRAEEIGTAIAFLASGACDFLTGSTLVVDGG